MADTLTLLGMPHSEALPVIIQQALKPGVDVSDLSIEAGRVLANGNVRNVLRPTEATTKRPNWPYQGAVEFAYRRIALQDCFLGISLRIQIPTGPDGVIDTFTHNVVAKLGEIFQLSFSQADYVNERIQGVGVVPYTLKAAPNSPRWKGKVSVHLYPLVPGD